MRTSIADSLDIDQNEVNDAIMHNESNRQKIEIFLDSEGPAKLLAYYQAPDTGSEND